MKVLILGGGLSAAYAWRSCLDMKITPDVVAQRIFVPPGGFIYAHWLPKSVDKRFLWEDIFIGPSGRPEIYAEKMWGHKYRFIKTSFPEFDNKVRGVNPLVAVRALWGDRNLLMKQFRLMKVTKDDLELLTPYYDVIVQTFPLDSESEWKTPTWVIPNKIADNTVIYNGLSKDGFSRASQLFGFLSYELPPMKKEQVNTYEKKFGETMGLYDIKGAKLWYAPEIAPEEVTKKPMIEQYSDKNVLYCGRWATGNRKFLSHETYSRVQNFIKGKL